MPPRRGRRRARDGDVQRAGKRARPAVPPRAYAAAIAAISNRRGVGRGRRGARLGRAHAPPPPPAGTILPYLSVGTREQRFRNKEKLEQQDRDAMPDGSVGNFFILPIEVVTYMYRKGWVGANESVKLGEVYRFFQREIIGQVTPIEQYENSERMNNPDAFMINEMLRLFDEQATGRPDPNLYAFYPEYSNETLHIPLGDVRDLPVYLLLYILFRCSEVHGTHRGQGFQVQYETNFSAGQIKPILNDKNKPVTITNNGLLSMKGLFEIYTTIMRYVAQLYPAQDRGVLQWNGSEGSGTRIMLYGGAMDLDLKLRFWNMRGQQYAGIWTQEMEDFITNNIGNSVVSVRNRKDNKCLLYCIVLGLYVKKMREGGRGGRMFNGAIMIEDYEVYSKGRYMFSEKVDDLSKLITRLSQYLFTPDYSTGEVDEIAKFVEDLDKKAGMMTSIEGFREGFKEVEMKLIPNREIGIDVYGVDYTVNKHIYPLYISKDRENVIELLCVTPNNSDFSHYCLILNMEKLMKKSGGKQFFSCSYCGEAFYHRRLLMDHHCTVNNRGNVVDGDGGYHYSVKDADPKVDITVGACSKCRLCFINDFHYEYHKAHCFMEGKTGYRHVQLVTYKANEHPTLKGVEVDMDKEEEYVKSCRICYADFECCIDPHTGEHSFMSYGFYDCKESRYITGRSIEEFVRLLEDIAFEAGAKEEQMYVYFHNAMNYDANFILRQVLQSKGCENWGIQVIMKSSNRLQKLVFHVVHEDGVRRAIHIGDTFLFLTLSLERIVSSIRKDSIEENKKNFPRFFETFHEHYRFASESEIDHILRKNIFPYKFFVEPESLLTPIEDFIKIFEPRNENLNFFSERVTLEDLEKGYDDTLHVIEYFKCKNADDYHNLYLMCDVMQLTDVFNRSMDILWESHHIHLTRYLGMPSATWAAFLRHDPTMEIPLYEDTFTAEFFKGMIRGGITSAAMRHAVAGYEGDPTQGYFYSILYLDVNGLYPHVMQEYPYPCGSFKFVPMGQTGGWAEVTLREHFDRLAKTQHGMCFCVDLEIPDSVKELTDMYPFAPEHRAIYDEYFVDDEQAELTPFLKKWSEANKGAKMDEFRGLVCTLYDKEKYNVHWRLLQFYMDHGVKVKRVLFGIEFEEGYYLRGYIRKNIEIRNGRKDELGKIEYKLLSNSTYGKTFESPMKRNTFEIVRDPVKLQGLLEEGDIAGITPIDNLGWIVKMNGDDIVLDKPTYIGACVCEYSKLHMYTLLYDKLMKLFPSRDGHPGCQLVYTDTDSFIIRVLHPDYIENSPEGLFQYIKTQEPNLIGSIGGQVKSETGEEETIQEVYALRSKVYAYRTTGGHIGKRAKGTTYDAQELQLDWETYQRTFESLTSFDTRNVQFVRKTFKVATLETFRRSLSVNDGKRHICADGVHTHAFGYPFPEKI